MDTRIAKERRTARKKVIEAIRNHWCIGNGWNREQWVDWLKDQGMISPRTNARDCRTATNTIAQLRSETLQATIFGQPPELTVAALRKERDRLRQAALANAAERGGLADSILRIQSRLQAVWDEACPDGMQPDMQIDDLIDAIEGELHRRHVILSNNMPSITQDDILQMLKPALTYQLTCEVENVSEPPKWPAFDITGHLRLMFNDVPTSIVAQANGRLCFHRNRGFTQWSLENGWNYDDKWTSLTEILNLDIEDLEKSMEECFPDEPELF